MSRHPIPSPSANEGACVTVTSVAQPQFDFGSSDRFQGIKTTKIINRKRREIRWFTKAEILNRRIDAYDALTKRGYLGTVSERRAAANSYVLTLTEMSLTCKNFALRGYCYGNCKDNRFNSKTLKNHYFGYYWDEKNNCWARVSGTYVFKDGKFVLIKSDTWFNFKPKKVNTVKLIRAITLYVINHSTLKDIYSATGVTPNNLYKSMERLAVTGKIGTKTFMKPRDLVRYVDIINAVRESKHWKYKTTYGGGRAKVVHKSLLHNAYNHLYYALSGHTPNTSAAQTSTATVNGAIVILKGVKNNNQN